MGRSTSEETEENLPVRFSKTSITVPAHVRRALNGAPPGTVIQLLRNSQSVADVVVTASSKPLFEVRQIVEQSTAEEGEALWVLSVDDNEITWDTRGDDEPQGPNALVEQWKSYGLRMEGVAFRAMSEMRQMLEVHGKVSKQEAKGIKALMKMAKKFGNETDEQLIKEQMEIDAETKNREMTIGLLKDILGFGAGGGGEAPAFVGQVWGLLNQEERNRILATDEGLTLKNARDERTARVALRALWGLISEGKVKLRPEVLAKATALYNGEAASAAEAATDAAT